MGSISSANLVSRGRSADSASGFSGSTIAGIVIGSIVGAALVIAVIYLLYRGPERGQSPQVSVTVVQDNKLCDGDAENLALSPKHTAENVELEGGVKSL